MLSKKQETARNVLEVGVYLGGSIKLWNDFFVNAQVYGLDINPIENNEGFRNKEQITLYASTDAYNADFVKREFVDKKIQFDFLLDDGPHSLESMYKFIELYTPLMTNDGIFIIEDVQSWDWIQLLIDAVPEELKSFIQVYDLRLNKNRYVFTIDKTK